MGIFDAISGGIRGITGNSSNGGSIAQRAASLVGGRGSRQGQASMNGGGNFQSSVTDSLANITEKLDMQSGPGDPTVDPTNSGDASINTFSDNVSQAGTGIYGSQAQRQQSVGYDELPSSPLLQERLATKKDSSFVKEYHPTFTKGYMNKSWDDFKNSEKTSDIYRNLDRPTKKSWNQTTIQANKVNQKNAINLANETGINTVMWNAKNKNIPL